MNRHSSLTCSLVLASLIATVSGCERNPEDANAAGAGGTEKPGQPAPTNRVDIPASVRRNLGVTFALVESRKVAQTLRVPGAFELTAGARREYRTPLAGRIELLAAPLQRVDAGTPLYRVESAAWSDFQEQVISATARVRSMPPLREAHRLHEKSLTDKVAIWEARLRQLEELRAAGGGSAALLTEAQATLNASQAELADVIETDAQLQAQQAQAESELRALETRRDLLARSRGCAIGEERTAYGSEFTVCAVMPGVVEAVSVTPGGSLEENGHVLTVVQPELVRFRARGLQADLGRLSEGLPVLITPPQGGPMALQPGLAGALQIGVTADARERTIDLFTTPRETAVWARAGVTAHMEITLAGGTEALAIPVSAVVRDGATAIIFRRDPTNADKAIRMEADLGLSDGRWIIIASGVKEGDEIIVGGNYQLMLATSVGAARGGHFHSDGTFHEGDH